MMQLQQLLYHCVVFSNGNEAMRCSSTKTRRGRLIRFKQGEWDMKLFWWWAPYQFVSFSIYPTSLSVPAFDSLVIIRMPVLHQCKGTRSNATPWLIRVCSRWICWSEKRFAVSQKPPAVFGTTPSSHQRDCSLLWGRIRVKISMTLLLFLK